jgi:hypothetical protein
MTLIVDKVKDARKDAPTTKHTEKEGEKGTILLLKILKLEATPYSSSTLHMNH